MIRIIFQSLVFGEKRNHRNLDIDISLVIGFAYDFQTMTITKYHAH